jgi:hypothetical protein
MRSSSILFSLLMSWAWATGAPSGQDINSGYPRNGGLPGNVLLAFGPE